MTVPGLDCLSPGLRYHQVLPFVCSFLWRLNLTSWGRGWGLSKGIVFSPPLALPFHPSGTGSLLGHPQAHHHERELVGFPQHILPIPTSSILHMAFRQIIKQKWNRWRSEHKRINSLELWLHNGNRLPRMNPCTEVMNSRTNALPWVHLYYCITPESIDKVAFFSLKQGMALNWIKVNVIILAEASSTADSGKGTLLNRVPELVYTFLHIVWLTDIEGWYII